MKEKISRKTFLKLAGASFAFLALIPACSGLDVSEQLPQKELVLPDWANIDRGNIYLSLERKKAIVDGLKIWETAYGRPKNYNRDRPIVITHRSPQVVDKNNTSIEIAMPGNIQINMAGSLEENPPKETTDLVLHALTHAVPALNTAVLLANNIYFRNGQTYDAVTGYHGLAFKITAQDGNETWFRKMEEMIAEFLAVSAKPDYTTNHPAYEAARKAMMEKGLDALKLSQLAQEKDGISEVVRMIVPNIRQDFTMLNITADDIDLIFGYCDGFWKTEGSHPGEKNYSYEKKPANTRGIGVGLADLLFGFLGVDDVLEN